MRVGAASLAIAALAAVSLVAGDVRADEREWYGWQTLVSDGATLGATGITAVATKGKTAAPAIVLLSGYLIPSPIIHAAHGNGGTAAASVGIRIGLPGVGFVTGAVIGDGLLDKFLWAVLLGTVGALGAVAVDAAVLGYEDKPSAAPPRQGSPLRVMSFGGTF